MLSKKMVSLLSEQIKNEFESAYLYLIVADYFHSEGLTGFSSWYVMQAKEETDHAMQFYDYLHSNTERMQFYTLEPCRNIFSDHVKPLEDSLVHERYITSCVNLIYDLAEKEKDYRTRNFLNWFVTEQQQEEENAELNLEKMNLYGENPAGLFLLDKEMAERSQKKTKGE